MQKYVISSSDANLKYCYYLPIVAVMWQRIGYTSLSLMLGDRKEWAKTPLTKYIYEKTDEVSKIITLKRIEGFQDSTIVQVARLFVAGEPFPEDDYLLTWDVDALPLNPSWFTQQDFNYDFNSFGGDWSSDLYCLWPQGARVKQWRILMGIFESDINNEMALAIDPLKDGWCYDESLLTERLSDYQGKIQIIPRWPNGRIIGRLDRYDWQFHGQTDLIDCHLFRPGYEHWDKLEPVFKAYCGNADYDYIKKYTEDFLNLCENM
jgi:hypothetical protein